MILDPRISELVCTADVAKQIGVCKMTIYRAVKKGKLKGIKIHRELYFRKKDINKYIQSLVKWNVHTAKTK